MIKKIAKIIIIFIIGIFGGIFADQILWPYFIERPLFYRYRLDQAPIVINKTEEITITENNALESAAEKIEKSIAEIRIQTESGKIIDGSGVIITSDGLILTLADLASQKGNISIFFNGKSMDCRILKKDSNSNLALLKVDETNLPTVGFAEFGSLRFGQRVFLTGVFFKNDSFSKIVNEGIIKNYDEEEIITNIIEESYAKGSPLFNIKGELVGLNEVNSKGEVSSIPINKIRDFIGF